MHWEQRVIVTNNLIKNSIIFQFSDFSAFSKWLTWLRSLLKAMDFVVKTYQDLTEVQIGGVISFLLIVPLILLGAWEHGYLVGHRWQLWTDILISIQGI